ncbi:RNA-guided endonuclease InsQ/TnpB family protein [Nocardia sp. NPDC050175]|uniref:RNA-guided endonuclease InsQ/TnpB family protein n=1 Tax=Nocardia sp. NPDC050175 TaxID=3364317 RepID=UPI0037BB6DF0
MDELVRYSFRLRPGRTAESALLAEWNRCRFLWNEAVHQQKSGRTPTFHRLSKLLTEARCQNMWLREGSQMAQQQTLRTYSQALTQSFTVKGRGRPVFKARKRARVSLEYTRRGFRICGGRLVLAKGISIPVVWSRYQQAARLAARLYKKPARQTRHDSRVWAKSVVYHHDVIAVEDFKPIFLAKSTLARKAADAAIGAAKRELIERGVRAGRRVVLVRPAYTSMTCSSCFVRAKQRLELGERTFRCHSCGFTDCRDRNAARVILAVAERGHTRVEDVRQSDHLLRVAGSVAV